MRLGAAILECVVFFYDNEENAEAGENPLGTGFLVWTNDGDSTRTHVYLVTCDHIVRASAPFHIVRWNQGASGTFTAATSELDWLPHPKNDDLSACYLGLDPMLGGRYAATSAFITEDQLETDVDLGEECVMVGCFAPHPGKARNVPVVRFGNVSMMPAEPVYMKERNFNQECFLVEMRSRGGYSGSPVYLLPSTNLESPHVRETLGICCGHFIETNVLTGQSENSGMAVVIPAWKIAELINRPEFREARGEQERGRDMRRARGDYSWPTKLVPLGR